MPTRLLESGQNFKASNQINQLLSMKDFHINVGKATLAHTKHISFLSDLRWGGGKEKMATGD